MLELWPRQGPKPRVVCLKEHAQLRLTLHGPFAEQAGAFPYQSNDCREACAKSHVQNKGLFNECCFDLWSLVSKQEQDDSSMLKLSMWVVAEPHEQGFGFK